jgi:hypothetical protein
VISYEFDRILRGKSMVARDWRCTGTVCELGIRERVDRVLVCMGLLRNYGEYGEIRDGLTK